MSLLSRFTHGRKMREAKDEMFVGELVRAMAGLDCPAIGFQAGHDAKGEDAPQAVRFKPTSDSVLHSVMITLDRKTGDGMIGDALLGSRATLEVQAEVKNYVSDPDDLLHMYQTDLKNIFKVPLPGNIRLDHQLNSVIAATRHIININDYIPMESEDGPAKLKDLLEETIGEMRKELEPYKKQRTAPEAAETGSE